MSTTSTDAFTAEILRSYLVSTVKEMVITTTRTAYSTCFCHGEDFTCGIFDETGRMIAQDQGVGVHAGGLEGAIASVIRHANGPFRPGDVYLHNDPYDGGTHQADVCVVRPMFAEHQLVGFATNRGHWSDVGGMAPGGWSGVAQDIVQEGLLLPSVQLMSAGEIREDIRRMVLRNVRLKHQCWGDLQAQIASAIAAERRIQALVERNGIAGYEAAVEAAISYSRRRFLAAVEQLPAREGFGEDVMEDTATGAGPFPIRARIAKQPDGRVLADFTGTSPQAPAPINCTFACTRAAVIGTLITMLDPDIPLNAGVTEMIEVVAPLGCMVNPTYPAPTFGTTADPVARAAEVLLRALSDLLPERAVAGSYSTGQNVTAGGYTDDGREFLWYSYQSGGCGAFNGGDGNSAMWHVMANSKNESCEAWEARYPLRYLAYRLRDGSGGAGKWRGGLGTERRWEIEVPTRVSAISGHHDIEAHGLDGAQGGAPNGFEMVRDGGEQQRVQHVFGLASPSKFANLPLRAGDVLISNQGGGGGFGDPRERDRDAVADDVRNGYITADEARDVYGWTG
ncbi:MAG: hydantoinase B/oxoprolinase family protein [Solirubrobacteraceae bacterium]|nr:hydantoinase B/oxoprolinase family protein [Solirubrobacteraceae bacterium]